MFNANNAENNAAEKFAARIAAENNAAAEIAAEMDLNNGMPRPEILFGKFVDLIRVAGNFSRAVIVLKRNNLRAPWEHMEICAEIAGMSRAQA